MAIRHLHDLSVVGNVTVATTGVTNNVLLTSTDTSSASAPDLVLYRNALIADSDTLGVLEFQGRNGMVTSSTAPLTYGAIYGRVFDASENHTGLTISANKGNGSGAFEGVANMTLIGTNNSGEGAIIINPDTDFELPNSNLEVKGSYGITTQSHGSSVNWKQAYDNYITGIAVTGTSTKTITLTQRDGGTISANFSDQSGSGGINMTNGVNNRVVTAVDLDTVNGEAGLLFGGSYLEITPGDIATPLHVKRTSASTRQVNLLLSATDSNSSSEGFLGCDSSSDLRWGGSGNTSLNSLVLTEDNTDFVVNSSTNSAIIRLAGGGTNFTSFSIGGLAGAITVNTGTNSLTIGHHDTSSASSVNNGNGTVIQDVTLDTYGHVTALGSVNLDNRYVHKAGGTFEGDITVEGLIQADDGFSSDGVSPFHSWRALQNTSNSSNQYYRIATISGSQSSRFIIELAGRSTSYSDQRLPAFGKIVGQLNNDNNYDIVYYNASATDEVVDEVGQVDSGTYATDIYVRVGQFAELTATAHISDGSITPYDSNSGSTSAPTGYVQATEYKLWNQGNDGPNSGLDADTLDGQHASAFLTAHPNISAASSSNNSGNTFIQDITLDSNGHITGLATGSASGFLTSESDTLATVTGRGATTTTSCTFNTITMNTPIVGSSAKIRFQNNDYIRFDDTANRFHFDVDGGTSNASVQAATFVGALSGNATTSTSTSRLTAVDDRDVKPTATGIVSGVKAIKPFFTTFNGMTGSQGGAYLDMIALDTYSDSSAGGPNAITFHKGESVGSPKMYIWKGAWNGSTWGTGQRVFADNYHPNADTLTTARTIAGSSFDGSANIDISYNNLTNLPTIPSGSSLVRVYQNQNYVASSSSTSNRGNFGEGLTVYEGYSSGSNRPHTYDTTLQIMSTGSQGFEISADWVNSSTTPLKVRSLRDCCQGWNPWTTIWTENNFSQTNVNNWNTAYGWGNHASAGYITGHPNISAASSSNNSGRTYIQDITLDSNGHVTGIATATETVTNTDTNNYASSIGFNTGNGVLTINRSGLSAITKDIDGRYAYYDHIRSLGTQAFTGGSNPNITTAQVISEIESDGGFDSFSSVFKTSWSYAGNYNLTDAGRFTETAGSSWITWTDNSSDSTRGHITALAIAPNTGGSAGKVFIYNDQGSSYAPGWREVWTNTSDGAGSGLDADLLDGQQGSYYLDYNNFTNTPTSSGISQSTADTRYVNVTGDTMTGNLQLGSNQLIFNNGYGNPTIKTYYGSLNITLGSSAGVVYVGTGSGNASGSIYAITQGGSSNSKVVYNNTYHSYYVGSSTEEMRLESDGDLHVEGDVTAYSTTVSDIRLKDNIVTIDNALDKVCKLRGVEYTWNKGSRKDTRDLGVIAQEVEKVLPEIVKEKKMPLIDDSETTYKSVDYEKITAVLVEAVKEQQAQIDELTTILEKLTKQLNNGNNV